VLDVFMPGMDGFETCRRIRALSQVPIIILTADADQSSKVKGLSVGADDYLTKPFDPEELLARIRAVLRRAHPASEGRWAEIGRSGAVNEPPFVCGDLRVDYANRTVTLKGEEVRLSPTEYRLLCQLTRNAGRVLPHEYLLTTVWGPEFRDDVKYLWVYIGYLREKLEADPKHPKHILTVPGFGYRFRKTG
jgi:two-component system KDP operon response regulator KdpE